MDLFSLKNRATSRKTDPQASQDAADAMNARDGVTKQEKEVLAALTSCGGSMTAKELGVEMAYRLIHKRYNVYKDTKNWCGVEKWMIREILTEAGKPHRRLSAMVLDGTVIRNEDGTYECQNIIGE